MNQQTFDIRQDINLVIQSKKNNIDILEKQKQIQINNINLFVERSNILVSSIDAAINVEKQAIETLLAMANGQLAHGATQSQPIPQQNSQQVEESFKKTEVKVEVIDPNSPDNKHIPQPEVTNGATG